MAHGSVVGRVGVRRSGTRRRCKVLADADLGRVVGGEVDLVCGGGRAVEVVHGEGCKAQMGERGKGE